MASKDLTVCIPRFDSMALVPVYRAPVTRARVKIPSVNPNKQQITSNNRSSNIVQCLEKKTKIKDLPLSVSLARLTPEVLQQYNCQSVVKYQKPASRKKPLKSNLPNKNSDHAVHHSWICISKSNEKHGRSLKVTLSKLQKEEVQGMVSKKKSISQLCVSVKSGSKKHVLKAYRARKEEKMKKQVLMETRKHSPQMIGWKSLQIPLEPIDKLQPTTISCVPTTPDIFSSAFRYCTSRELRSDAARRIAEYERERARRRKQKNPKRHSSYNAGAQAKHQKHSLCDKSLSVSLPRLNLNQCNVTQKGSSKNRAKQTQSLASKSSCKTKSTYQPSLSPLTIKLTSLSPKQVSQVLALEKKSNTRKRTNMRSQFSHQNYTKITADGGQLSVTKASYKAKKRGRSGPDDNWAANSHVPDKKKVKPLTVSLVCLPSDADKNNRSCSICQMYQPNSQETKKRRKKSNIKMSAKRKIDFTRNKSRMTSACEEPAINQQAGISKLMPLSIRLDRLPEVELLASSSRRNGKPSQNKRARRDEKENTPLCTNNASASKGDVSSNRSLRTRQDGSAEAKSCTHRQDNTNNNQFSAGNRLADNQSVSSTSTVHLKINKDFDVHTTGKKVNSHKRRSGRNIKRAATDMHKTNMAKLRKISEQMKTFLQTVDNLEVMSDQNETQPENDRTHVEENPARRDRNIFCLPNMQYTAEWLNLQSQSKSKETPASSGVGDSHPAQDVDGLSDISNVMSSVPERSHINDLISQFIANDENIQQTLDRGGDHPFSPLLTPPTNETITPENSPSYSPCENYMGSQTVPEAPQNNNVVKTRSTVMADSSVIPVTNHVKDEPLKENEFYTIDTAHFKEMFQQDSSDIINEDLVLDTECAMNDILENLLDGAHGDLLHSSELHLVCESDSD